MPRINAFLSSQLQMARTYLGKSIRKTYFMSVRSPLNRMPILATEKVFHHQSIVQSKSAQPTQPINTATELVTSENEPVGFLQSIENRYQSVTKDKPNLESFLVFLLKKGLYVLAASLAGYAIKEYVDAEKELNHIALDIQNLVLENASLLEKKRILQVQPRLYLTTVISDKDALEHKNNQNELNQRLDKLKIYQYAILQLKGKLEIHLPRLPIYKRGQLKNKLNSLQVNLAQQIEQLEITKVFDLCVWLHKNRQYLPALNMLDEVVIKKLESYREDLSKDKPKKIFNLNQILTACYNAQAKLHACISKTSEDERNKMNYSNASINSYEKAVELSKENENEEYAVLLSSKAYLHNDRAEFYKNPAERNLALEELRKALSLRKQALDLKPGDEHILCGMGLDLHRIEKTKPVGKRDLSQLEAAYGYFTKAILLNDNEPNIYVSRGQLRVDMEDEKGALEDFERALRISSIHSEANIEKARLLLKRGQCELAKKAYGLGLITLVEWPAAITKHRKKMSIYEDSIKCNCRKISQLGYFNLYPTIADRQSVKSQESYSKSSFRH